MAAPKGQDPVLAQLRPLLARQLSKLRGRYLVHGVAKTLLCTLALVSLFYVLDRWLRLPTPVRIVHTIIAAAACGLASWRFIRYPMTRRFTDLDLAMWIESAQPDLHQRLVSALQLHDGGAADRNQSQAMIGRLWQETAEQTRALRTENLFDNRSLSRVVAGAALITATLALGAALSPDSARIFLLRHVGLGIEYPRATRLTVELPRTDPKLANRNNFKRVDSEGLTELTMPAGADLPVSVLAEGVVPKEAFLDVKTRRDDDATSVARTVPLTPRPGDRFRHVFRRLSGQFEFRARGGDDERGDRLVVVRTVRPAQVSTLSATITPPAYTGVMQIEQQGGAIEALAGSEVMLRVTATAPVREAQLVFLESGKDVALKPIAPQDDGGTSLSFTGTFTLETSDRYEIRLVAENGLRNPKPGTYPISALQDYAPVGRWLLPEDDTLALLPTGLLCLRVDVRDDFGLTAAELSIERGGNVALTASMLPPPEPAAPRSPPVKRAFPTKLFEVRELLGGTEGGKGLFAQLTLRDNKMPQAGVAELPRRIVQIVDPQQLAGIIAKRFRRLREEVEQAESIQQDRSERLDDLVARVQAGDETVSAGELAQILTGIEVGQGRIQSAVQRVTLGLMRAFDLHLWNRLEPSQHAATVVALYRDHVAGLTEPTALDPAFYRDLNVRRKAGTLGAMETTLDPILSMFELTDSLATDDAPKVTALLAKAQIARGEADRTPLLTAAQVRQQRIRAVLAELLLRLEEWNDYQDLVQEVRALRDRQRDLQNRTEEARGK